MDPKVERFIAREGLFLLGTFLALLIIVTLVLYITDQVKQFFLIYVPMIAFFLTLIVYLFRWLVKGTIAAIRTLK